MIAKLHGGIANLREINIPDGLREIYIPISDPLKVISSGELPAMPNITKQRYTWTSGRDFCLEGATFTVDEAW